MFLYFFDFVKLDKSFDKTLKIWDPNYIKSQYYYLILWTNDKHYEIKKKKSKQSLNYFIK